MVTVRRSAAVELAARLGRVVERAHALDLDAPVFLVLREAVLARVGADEALARALLVVLVWRVDLRLQLRIASERRSARSRPLTCGAASSERLARALPSARCALRLARLREQLLLLRLELALRAAARSARSLPGIRAAR